MLNQLKPLFGKISEWVEVRIKLLKINFILSASSLMSYFLYALICLFVFFCLLLFAGFGLKEVFVEAGLSNMGATLTVFAIYLLLFILLMVCRKPITRFFSSRIIEVMTEETGKAEEEDED